MNSDALTREERHVRFSGDRAGQQGFTGAGRADQQHALGDFRADLVVLAGVLQEVHDFDQLALGFLVSGHVGELGLHAVFLAVLLGLALPELHDAALAALGTHEEEVHQAEQQA